MELLNKLITDYKNQKDIIWEEVKTLETEFIVDYNNLENIPKNLDNVGILKLNGGLGTSMGCTKAKSLIKVKNNLTFLDIITRQIERFEGNVPLILMNSINTEEDTKNNIKNSNIDVIHFNQSFSPRLDENYKPYKTQFDEKEQDYWYPPGHGDIYNSLINSGVLTKLKQKGIKYLFISNSDNLGATFDGKILNYMQENDIDFLMEVVPKTKADVKGGALIKYNNKINLLEVAQVPDKNLEEFYDIEKFKYFNTNNIWINIEKIDENINMEVIKNPKKLMDGRIANQLEIAMGSAIKSFDKSIILEVPRTRFIPVKKCQDLFLIQSNLFNIDDNYNVICNTNQLPVIQFSDNYKKLEDFEHAFQNGIPDLSTLKSLKLENVRIFTDEKLEGDLII